MLNPAGAGSDESDESAARADFAFTAVLLAVVFLAAVGTRVLGAGPDLSPLWHVRWQVYTGTAERVSPVAYRYSGGRFDRVTQPVGAPEYHWGLSHGGNADLVRLLATVAKIPAAAWQPCAAATVDACAAVVRAAPVSTVPSAFPDLCGPVVFAEERGAAEGTTPTVLRVASVDLTCAG